MMSNTTIVPKTDAPKAQLGEAKTELAVAAKLGDTVKAEKAQAAAAAAQKELTKKQQQRAVVGWALSSSFALIVCGLLSLGLIGSVSTGVPESGTWGYVFSDVVVTGLAVGAGTKPLHDLITRIEKSTEKVDPATDPAVPATG